MHDELEKFVKRHRDAFDDKQPGKHVWKTIQKDLVARYPKKKNHYLGLWRAAAVFLFVLSVWLVFEKIGLNQQGGENYVYESSEMHAAEQFYFAVISEKKQELVHFGKGVERLENNYFSDLNALDSAYAILKSDMKLGNTNEIEDAMILNLQLRIELLNRQLNVFKALKNENTHENMYL